VSTEGGGASALRIVWLYPDLLSTYGDRGNLLILARRARLRGLPVEAVEVRSDQAVPTRADIYLLGGGEDGPQALAAQRLNTDRGLHKAVDRRAVVFCVCAGYQLLGSSFYAKGARHAGLALLDVESDRGPTRAVGELVGEVDAELGLPTLTGFENHGGRTHVGSAARPLARVVAGIGNDGRTEGAWQGSVLGTYSHGPALARNPALADLLLSWATGIEALDPIDDTWADRLRGERLAAVRRGRALAARPGAAPPPSRGAAAAPDVELVGAHALVESTVRPPAPPEAPAKGDDGATVQGSDAGLTATTDKAAEPALTDTAAEPAASADVVDAEPPASTDPADAEPPVAAATPSAAVDPASGADDGGDASARDVAGPAAASVGASPAR
jgi:CobQ-like glutamine amidotransferase family enzyme